MRMAGLWPSLEKHLSGATNITATLPPVFPPGMLRRSFDSVETVKGEARDEHCGFPRNHCPFK